MSHSCDPIDCNLPGSCVHGIFQARILEWVAISFSRGSSQPRNWTQVFCIAGRFFTYWATREEITKWWAPNQKLLYKPEPSCNNFEWKKKSHFSVLLHLTSTAFVMQCSLYLRESFLFLLIQLLPDKHPHALHCFPPRRLVRLSPLAFMST